MLAVEPPERRSLFARIGGALGIGRGAAAAAKRGYDGASRGRGTDGWVAGGTAADSEIGIAAPVLRARMRDLVRNNPLAAQAVQVLVNNLVGTGIRPRAATGDKELDKKVDALWARWAAACDASGQTDFHGLLSLAVRLMVEGGDCFAVRRWRRASDGLPLPLQIELREADHLDAAKHEDRPGGGRIRHGIEFDAIGRRTAYWLFPDHPGDTSPGFARRWESVRMEASRVAHLFERQRQQTRGVPWGAPAMRAIRDVDDWQRAEMVRKKTEACLVGVVYGAEEDQQAIAPVVEDSEGNRVEEWQPGLVAYARGTKDVKFNQPAATGGVYEWNRVQLHAVAAGFRVPYALMTGDLKDANFSSSRVGLNEFRRMVEALQWQLLIPVFCQRVWGWFAESAHMAGLLPRPDIAVEWAPPAFESVNPLQDAQADLLLVRSGMATLPQAIARRGWDPKAVLAEWAAFAAEVDAAGLVFDSDPRRVAKSGLLQMEPAAGGASGGPPPKEEA